MHTYHIMMSCPRYLIAVATYRRPTDLKRLLDSLLTTVDFGNADIVVVDNDAQQSARPVAISHPTNPKYVVEPDPGIASARNRALDFFSDDYHAIIFVDDDEWMDPAWFRTLVGYASQTAAGVVQGPVITILPTTAPDWIAKGGFFQRSLLRTGDAQLTAATNNVLLTRSAWRGANTPRFDPEFSETGGSDWDFFWGVRKAGATILYCAEAIAYEDVPSARLSWEWLRRRYKRNGLVVLRSRRKHGEHTMPFVLKTAAAVAIGVVQVVTDLVGGKGVRALPVERIYRGVGVAQGLIGKNIYEYRR